MPNIFYPARKTNWVIATTAVLVALAVLAWPAFAASNPVAQVNNPLVPDATAPGGAAFTLTVNGAGFISGAAVNWNGSPHSTTFVSPVQLTASIAASDIASYGTARVTVTNPGTIASNVAFFSISSPTSPIVFNTSTLATPMNLESIAAADFNGDGKQDLAVGDNNSEFLTVFLGNGDGTFQNPVSYTVGSGAIDLGVGDFNGDGALDLAVVHTRSGVSKVSLLLGNGDGTFRQGGTFEAGPAPHKVAIGDFNGDGKLDLVFSEYSSNSSSVAVLLGNGDGTFGKAAFYSTGQTVSYNVAVGDFNKDGKLDLAVSAGNAVCVLLGNGDGTFQKGVDYPLGGAGFGIAVADFNGDGNPDVAVIGGANSYEAVLLGNGDGTLQRPTFYPAGNLPETIAVGDFNADGIPDLATGDYNGSSVSILLNDGEGGFQPAVTYAGASFPEGIALGDFNGSGRLGVATANYGEASVSVLQQAPFVQPSPASLTFPGQHVHSSGAPQNVTVFNTGGATLSITGISVTGANPHDYSEQNDCGATLAIGASCTVTVTFSPNTGGTLTAMVSITDNAVGSPQNVPLTGMGLAVKITPVALNFGSQKLHTVSPPMTATLTNDGNGPLTFQSIAIAGPARGDFSESNTCGSSIPGHASCTIVVRFVPTQTGLRKAHVSVSDSGGDSPQRLSISGTGS